MFWVAPALTGARPSLRVEIMAWVLALIPVFSASFAAQGWTSRRTAAACFQVIKWHAAPERSDHDDETFIGSIGSSVYILAERTHELPSVSWVAVFSSGAEISDVTVLYGVVVCSSQRTGWSSGRYLRSRCECYLPRRGVPCSHVGSS